jgi:protein-S-isoprenylcysteine O-methyltransferase Ste14
MRASIRSTSTRTFLLVPTVIAIEQALTRRKVHGRWLPLLVTGYLTYRLTGSYRTPRAGGPPGMSQGMPEQIVQDGPYALTRNPMYLGHLIFLTGLTLATRSPLAAAIAGFHLAWFRERVQRDEQRLRDQFGTAYVDYCARVPRWLPGSPRQ